MGMYQEALGGGVLRLLMKSKSIRTTYFCAFCVAQYLPANPAVCHDSLEQRPDPPRPFKILGPESVMTENNDISCRRDGSAYRSTGIRLMRKKNVCWMAF